MQSPTDHENFLQTARHNPTYFEVASHLGQVIDYCVPANAYFPTQEMHQALVERLPALLKYYPDYRPESVSILSEIVNVNPINLLTVNGSTEIITTLVNNQMQGPILVDIPTFGRWTDLPRDIGKSLVTFQRRMDQGFHIDPEEFIAFAIRSKVKSMVLCNPNNPTGSLSKSTELLHIIRRLSHLELIVIDESFMPFADDPLSESLEKLVSQLGNVLVIKSLGKAIGWHGVRLGFVVGNRQLIDGLRPLIPYWNINGIAQFALSLVRDHPNEFYSSLARIVEDRRSLEQRLREIPGLTVFSSQANFAFFQLPHPFDGLQLRDRLLKRHKLFVRECSNKIGSSSSFFRIAARPKEDTDRLTKTLRSELRFL